MWFKILLLVYFGGSALLLLHRVGSPDKLKPTATSTAISALMTTLLAIGVWLMV